MIHNFSKLHVKFAKKVVRRPCNNHSCHVRCLTHCRILSCYYEMSNNSQFSSHKWGSSYTIKINSTLYNLSMKPSTLGPNFFISREIYGNFQNWNFPSAQVNESTQNMLSGASQSETAITSRLRRKPWPSSVRCEAACKWRRAAVCWWSACWSGPHLRPLLGSATLRGLSISSGSESALLSVHKNAPVKCHISHLSGPKMCNLHRTTYNDVLCVGGASEACDMAVPKKRQKKLFTSQTCYLPRPPTLTYPLKFCTGFEIKGGVSPPPTVLAIHLHNSLSLSVLKLGTIDIGTVAPTP